MLGFSLGIYSTQQYQVSALPSPTVPEKSSTLSRTVTPIQTISPVQTSTIEAITSATRDLFFCMDNYVDWSTYKNKPLGNIQNDIGHTLLPEEKDGFFKTNAQFVGRLSIDGEPIFDRLGFPIYLFEQNEKTYQVSVNPRINN